MTRILTIIALLFATPMLAACALGPEKGTEEYVRLMDKRTKKLNLSGAGSSMATQQAQNAFVVSARKKISERERCLAQGHKRNTEGFRNCLWEPYAAEIRMKKLEARVEAAEKEASRARTQASRARTQAIISTITANEAKRRANTIPYGKDCPWLNGCKK